MILHEMRRFTLSTYTDTFETYFDSHVDLFQRKLQKQSDRLKLKAEENLKSLKIKDISGDLLAENLEREVKNIKLKVRRPARRAISRFYILTTALPRSLPRGCPRF